MRLFTFGCSFTNFFWPTWADIIATDLDIDYYNYGVSGMGNTGIQSRIVEADFKHDLTTDDLAIVVWSTWSREDRYLDGWKAGGTVFNNNFYDEDFLNKYWSWENDIIKNTTAIHMTRRAYKDIIKYHGSVVGFPTVSNNLDIFPYLSKLVNKMFTDVFGMKEPEITVLCKRNLFMPECLETNGNSQFNKRCSDSHPDVLHHMNFVTKYIYPKLGYTLKPSTIQLFTDIHNDLMNAYEPTDTLEILQQKTPPILAKYNIKKSSI
jgi:hypothetical protein